MEGLNTLLDPLSGSEFFTTIDLKDAYFSIPIHADHYKYEIWVEVDSLWIYLFALRAFFRDLEVCKLTALSSSDGDYNAIVYLSQLARDSLQWFVVNSHLYNGTRISKPSKVLTMTTDASHSEWGVVCGGVSSSGLWSSEEQAMHINWLELSAVLFGVKCFVHSHNCLVKVFCDNSTAVTYINNLGGMVPSLHAVSKSIWEWCFAHHCVEAFHIPVS